VDRRWRAARDGGVVLTLTAIVAVVVNARESPGPTVPAKVTVIGSVGPDTEHVEFLVRGGGCSHAEDHLHGPGVQYRTHSVEVKFRVDRDGITPCPTGDPGVLKTLTLVTPLSSRQLLDATATPPTPFPTEPGRPFR
jgi:hypothetical protein